MLTKGLAGRTTVGLAALLLAMGAAMAGPVIDGVYDPTEGYTDGHYVNFNVTGGKVIPPVTGGQLWTYLDPTSGDLSFMFSQPTSINDNTWGTLGQEGWGSSCPTGHNHSLSDLLGSDKAEFQFYNGLGQKVWDGYMDYAKLDGGIYKSMGVLGGDGSMVSGSASALTAWNTSLAYDLQTYKPTTANGLANNSPITDPSYTPNASYPDWVYNVIYEGTISGSAFGTSGYGYMLIPGVHDSPNKVGDNLVPPVIDGPITPPPVPEPSSLLLLSAGLLPLLRRRRAA